MRRALALLPLLIASCGSDTVALELEFPSPDTFVRSETVRVFVVPLGEGQEGTCPELLMQAELGPLETAVDDTGEVNICDFQAGASTVSEVGEGLRAYVAVAYSDAGQAYLTGCTVSDVYIDEPPLTVIMTPTAEYLGEYRAGDPSETCTPEMKCRGGC